MRIPNPSDWLGLAIGNSRLYWAWFRGETLQETHRSEHLRPDSPAVLIPPHWPEQLPLAIASVVPQQTLSLKESGLWGAIAEIQLAQVPLAGIYATMGIDRALSLFGAAQTYGAPILVIDAGTALTLTAAIPSPPPLTLLGGAILPGLRLQFQMLGKQTAALPEVELPTSLPERWSSDTQSAIASGVLYSVLAGIRDFIADWRDRFPESPVILTGGDAEWLEGKLLEIPGIIIDPHLIFWGMRAIIVNTELRSRNDLARLWPADIFLDEH